MIGFIYVLSNPTMPGLLKIGFTMKHFEQRRRGLQTTGVPESFVLEALFRVAAPVDCEKAIHRELGSFRHAPNREFLRIGLRDALETVWTVVKPLLYEAEDELLANEEPHPFPELTEDEEQILWVVVDMPRWIAIDQTAIQNRLGWKENEVKLGLLDLKSKGFLVHKKFRGHHHEIYWELSHKGLKYDAWLRDP